MHAHVLYLSVSIVSLVSTSNERRVRKRVQGEQTTGKFFLDTLPSTQNLGQLHRRNQIKTTSD